MQFNPGTISTVTDATAFPSRTRTGGTRATPRGAGTLIPRWMTDASGNPRQRPALAPWPVPGGALWRGLRRRSTTTASCRQRLIRNRHCRYHDFLINAAVAVAVATVGGDLLAGRRGDLQRGANGSDDLLVLRRGGRPGAVFLQRQQRHQHSRRWERAPEHPDGRSAHVHRHRQLERRTDRDGQHPLQRRCGAFGGANRPARWPAVWVQAARTGVVQLR